jgi:hypothetical protein
VSSWSFHSQATISGTPDNFLDYSGFTSPLVPGAFNHSSPHPDPYLPEESSRSRSPSPLTSLPSPFAADIEVSSAHLPALSTLSASHSRSLSASTSSSSTSSDSSPSLSFLFSPSFHSSVVVTVHILSHRVYLFSFLRRTHLLWGLYSYDWYHCMYLVGSTSFSLFLL